MVTGSWKMNPISKKRQLLLARTRAEASRKPFVVLLRQPCGEWKELVKVAVVGWEATETVEAETKPGILLFAPRTNHDSCWESASVMSASLLAPCASSSTVTATTQLK